jgi:hypothetical protein
VSICLLCFTVYCTLENAFKNKILQIIKMSLIAGLA